MRKRCMIRCAKNARLRAAVFWQSEKTGGGALKSPPPIRAKVKTK